MAVHELPWWNVSSIMDSRYSILIRRIIYTNIINANVALPVGQLHFHAWTSEPILMKLDSLNFLGHSAERDNIKHSRVKPRAEIK